MGHCSGLPVDESSEDTHAPEDMHIGHNSEKGGQMGHCSGLPRPPEDVSSEDTHAKVDTKKRQSVPWGGHLSGP